MIENKIQFAVNPRSEQPRGLCALMRYQVWGFFEYGWNGRQPTIEAIATQGLELNLDLFAWRVVSLNRKSDQTQEGP